MGTAACGGKRCKGWAAVSGERPISALGSIDHACPVSTLRMCCTRINPWDPTSVVSLPHLLFSF